MHHTKTILLASLLLFPLSALAQTEVPNAFSDGTPALAAEVNENFTAVADGVNAQDVRIQSVENAIAGPAEMVFLGYAAGTQTNNFYAANQICKNAFANSAARILTTEAWTSLVNGGQMPLPSQPAGVWVPQDGLLAHTGYGSGYLSTVIYSPSANSYIQVSVNYCIVSTDGKLTCPSQQSGYELTACMAPAG